MSGVIRLIVGLGNPGAEYACTRHNAGFWLLDNLAKDCRVSFSRQARWSAMTTKARLGHTDVWLMQPLTFMNRSGSAVGPFARFFNMASEEILVVHDELDMLPGVAKIKKGGSAGGHNGLKDITAVLGTPDYWRLRVGIGHPRSLGYRQSVVDFVLARPAAPEQVLIEEAIERSVQVIPTFCEGRCDQAIMHLHSP